MKRLLVLFAVLTPLSLLIAGCGGQGGGSSKGPVVDQKEMMQTKMKGMDPATKMKMMSGTDPKGTGTPGAPRGQK